MRSEGVFVRISFSTITKDGSFQTPDDRAKVFPSVENRKRDTAFYSTPGANTQDSVSPTSRGSIIRQQDKNKACFWADQVRQETISAHGRHQSQSAYPVTVPWWSFPAVLRIQRSSKTDGW